MLLLEGSLEKYLGTGYVLINADNFSWIPSSEKYFPFQKKGFVSKFMNTFWKFALFYYQWRLGQNYMPVLLGPLSFILLFTRIGPFFWWWRKRGWFTNLDMHILALLGNEFWLNHNLKNQGPYQKYTICSAIYLTDNS